MLVKTHEYYTFLPNAETEEVSPREQVVSAHKYANVGYCNILKYENLFKLAEVEQTQILSSVIGTFQEHKSIVDLIP